MPIRFLCRECHARIKVADGTEGRKVKCPKCGASQRVPQAQAVDEVTNSVPNENVSLPSVPDQTVNETPAMHSASLPDTEPESPSPDQSIPDQGGPLAESSASAPPDPTNLPPEPPAPPAPGILPEVPPEAPPALPVPKVAPLDGDAPPNLSVAPSVASVAIPQPIPLSASLDPISTNPSPPPEPPPPEAPPEPPAPGISPEAPPEALPEVPLGSPRTSTSARYVRPVILPGYAGLLWVSWLLMAFAGLVGLVSVLSGLMYLFRLGGRTLAVGQVLGLVMLGLLISLLMWGAGLALQALRDLVRNSYRSG